MKTASKVLGIVGGALTLLAVAFTIFMFFMFSGEFMTMGEPMFENMFGAFMPLVYIFGAISAIGGILGIIGGCLVVTPKQNMDAQDAKRRNTVAGIFMAVGAAGSFLVNSGFISSVMLILGAVFAFLRDKSATAEPQTSPPLNDITKNSGDTL